MSALTPSDVLEVLDADATTEKRASWEAFEFTLVGDSEIEVVNTSYENPHDHTYSVYVEGGLPADCTCPAFEYQDGPCKHLVAVAIRAPLLEAVTAVPSAFPDGGTVVNPAKAESAERPEDCDCAPSMEDLPCWPCYRDGFEEPNPDAEVSEE